MRCHVTFTAAAAAKSLQSCPTLCDPIEGSSNKKKKNPQVIAKVGKGVEKLEPSYITDM